MFKEMAQLGNLLKQAQSLSGKFQGLQERLAEERLSASSDDGLVSLVATGTGEIVACTISPELMMSNRRQDLEQRVVTAINAVQEAVKANSATALSEITGGLDLGAMGQMLGLGSKSS